MNQRALVYGNYPTIYLRKKFDIGKASQVKALILNAGRDDGLVAWINGVEVWRFNVPDGRISSTTNVEHRFYRAARLQ